MANKEFKNCNDITILNSSWPGVLGTTLCDKVCQ